MTVGTSTAIDSRGDPGAYSAIVVVVVGTVVVVGPDTGIVVAGIVVAVMVIVGPVAPPSGATMPVASSRPVQAPATRDASTTSAGNLREGTLER